MLWTVRKVGKGVGSLFVSSGDEQFHDHSKITPFTLQLLSASNLLASDTNGLSDPYVVLKLGDSRQWRSTIASRTLNPVWSDQSHMVEGQCLDLLKWMVIEVWDSDVTSADDPLGLCMLPIQQLLVANGPVEIPLGRASPRLKAAGSIRVELIGERAIVDSSTTLASDATRFAALCQEADSTPNAVGLHIASHERLEVSLV